MTVLNIVGMEYRPEPGTFEHEAAEFIDSLMAAGFYVVGDKLTYDPRRDVRKLDTPIVPREWVCSECRADNLPMAEVARQVYTQYYENAELGQIASVTISWCYEGHSWGRLRAPREGTWFDHPTIAVA